MEKNKKKIRRICLYSGPSGGKSITAANIRAQLGFKGYDIELVEEIIKDWTYIPRIPTSADSLYLQSCQIQKEDIRLRAGVDLIITDSPVFLQYFYGRYHKDPFRDSMQIAFKEFDQMYPALNIFIDREDKFYNQIGRYENFRESKHIDTLIKGMLVENKMSFTSFSCLDQEHIINYIISEVEKND